MPNWTLYWPAGPPFKGIFPSQAAAEIDAFLAKTVNAAEGSAHTAQSVVQIGGAGGWFPGAFRADQAQVTIPALTTWAAHTTYSSPQLIFSGGALYLCTQGGTSGGVAITGIGTNIPDGSVTWNYVAAWSPIGLLINGLAEVGSTGVWSLQAGAQGFVRAGASITVQGANGNPGQIIVGTNGLIDVTTGANLNVESLAAINLNGFLAAINVNSSALISVNNGGGVAWASGATGIFNAGSSLLLYSTMTVETGGEIAVNAGGQVQISGVVGFGAGSFATWFAGSFLTQAAGSTWGLAGTTNVSGATTLTSAGTLLQQGVVTKDGPTGYSVDRVAFFSGSTSVNPEQFDVIVCEYSGGGTITLTCDPPPHTTGIRSRVSMPNIGFTQVAGTIKVKDQASGNILYVATGSSPGAAFASAGFVDVMSANVSGTWQWIPIGANTNV